MWKFVVEEYIYWIESEKFEKPKNFCFLPIRHRLYYFILNYNKLFGEELQ